jgi:hypothetical protein
MGWLYRFTYKKPANYFGNRTKALGTFWRKNHYFIVIGGVVCIVTTLV